MTIVQRQNAEIEMLKHSVSTLIDTVSKLEELVLFHQTNGGAVQPAPDGVDRIYGPRGDAMSEEIESLKQRVRDLECGAVSTRSDSKHEELRRWLTDEVELGQYLDVLVDHGFEDLVAVQTLTMDILNEVDGIDKIGHQARIMHFVQRLKDAAEQIHEF